MWYRNSQIYKQEVMQLPFELFKCKTLSMFYEEHFGIDIYCWINERKQLSNEQTG